MKLTDSSIIIVRNVFIFSSRGHDRKSSEQNNRKLISLHNNGEDDKHAHGFADSNCWEHISTWNMHEFS
jgi:hypothetical protein